MNFEFILVVLTLLYVGQVVLFLVGLSKIRDEQFDGEPFVSVVIAARNEEESLAACLSSVTNQTYPPEKFEVIVMNDYSTDGTEQVGNSFVQRYPNVTLYRVQDDQQLQGKTNALAQGIDLARGEIILITDADCTVPSTWIEQTVRRYAPAVGVVGGMTLQQARNSFEGMQSLDWAYLLGVAASSAALGMPLTSIGNNFSFRKEAYNDVGGYRSLPFSITEDYRLFQAIIATQRWAYRYPLDPTLLVISQPCRTVRDIFRQKHRWGTGGREMKLSGLWIMAVGFSLHAALLVGLVVGQITAVLTALLVKSIADYAFLHRVLSRVQRRDLLIYFFSFELYFILYVVALPFIVFLGGKVVWKGRTY
jgi:cellulose synthase/poly-beta-1,6-N-acetylglucosamine synthase-like glycosyltransferase